MWNYSETIKKKYMQVQQPEGNQPESSFRKITVHADIPGNAILLQSLVLKINLNMFLVALIVNKKQKTGKTACCTDGNNLCYKSMRVIQFVLCAFLRMTFTKACCSSVYEERHCCPTISRARTLSFVSLKRSNAFVSI